MNISSKEVLIDARPEEVFELLSNCNNFSRYLPEVQDWHSTEEKCNFLISGIGKIALEIVKKEPYSSVSFEIQNSQLNSVAVVFSIKEEGTQTKLDCSASLEVPFFLAQMIKSSLSHFMDMLIERIKMVVENNTTV